MTLNEIIEAQDLHDMSLSYFDANEYNKLPKTMCVISATTNKYGTFRFKANKKLELYLVKDFIDKWIKLEVENECGIVRFDGEYVEIK